MKKLISAALALILSVSLAVPAMAASPESNRDLLAPEAQAWLDAHPEETEAFLLNIDSYAETLYGYSDLTELAWGWGISEGEAQAMLLEEFVSMSMYREDQEAFLTQYEADHPGTRAALEANARNYFTQVYPWYDSPEAYMQDWDLTEEEFLDEMLYLQVQDLQWQEEEQSQRDDLKEELGGVPGQLGVMLNGTYLSFPDAAPQAVDGRIMVPYRPLMEALGGQVAYDETSQTVSCILGETTLTLTLGETSLTVEEGETSSTLEMDCAAYAQDNRTYVPVRFVSQAFGYDVLWDQSFETAVLLDREEIVAENDSLFTVLNRALTALQPAAGQTVEENGQLRAQLTLFDSLDGDKTYTFTGESRSVSQDAALQLTYTLDLSQLMEIPTFSSFMAELLHSGWMTEQEQAQLERLLNALDDLSFELRMDPDSGIWYVRSPLLELWQEGVADTWVAFEPAGAQLPAVPFTVGSLLYDLTLANLDGSTQSIYEYSLAPVYAYSELMDDARQAAAVLGDGCFEHTAQGDVYAPDWSGLLGVTEEELDAVFTELDFSFVIAEDGSVSGSFAIRPDWSKVMGTDSSVIFLRPALLFALPDIRAAGEFSLTPKGSELTVDLHLQNSFRLELESNSTARASGSAPVLTPDAGETVISADEIL